jgi:hypothetical protein
MHVVDFHIVRVHTLTFGHGLTAAGKPCGLLGNILGDLITEYLQPQPQAS